MSFRSRQALAKAQRNAYHQSPAAKARERAQAEAQPKINSMADLDAALAGGHWMVTDTGQSVALPGDVAKELATVFPSKEDKHEDGDVGSVREVQ